MSKTPPEQDAAFAAEFDADVSREKIAEVYAAALSGACDDAGVSFSDVLEEFASLLDGALDRYPKFEEILASAMVPTREKERILNETLQNADGLFRGLMMTLARRGRLDLTRDIYRQCRLLDDKKRGRVPVIITTAAELSPESRQSLAAKLRDLIGGEPQISSVVDPDVIGGVIVRVGDTVFDASIATQLDNVRQQLIDRSAHEIQSRRNSFRNTEGN